MLSFQQLALPLLGYDELYQFGVQAVSPKTRPMPKMAAPPEFFMIVLY